MLTSKSLWFSHIKYMNDAEEWFYAVRLFESVLQEYKDFPNIQDAYSTIKQNSSSYSYEYFTFSFSEEKDLLSQWRGYCPNGGYSFCIADRFLNEMIQKYRLLFKPCIYEEEKQIEFIKNIIIGKTPEQLDSQRQDDAEREEKSYGSSLKYNVSHLTYELAQNMYQNIQLLCLIKHPSFAEEREWRMIASLQHIPPGDYMKLRASRNMLIPYLDLPISTEVDAIDEYNPDAPRRSRWEITEIVVGPHPHQELAIAACKLAIPPYIWNHLGTVTASTIPYVSW